MMFVRRFVAVVLGVLLVIAFALSLVASRLNATALNAGFYQEQLRELDAYTLVNDELLPRALDDFLADQSATLPENLRGVVLPADPESRKVMLDILRLAMPEDALRDQTEAALDEVVPYFAGRSDGFDVRLRAGDQLRALTAHAPGEPSRLRQAWHDLNLGESTIRGLAEESRRAEQSGAGEPGVLDAVGGDLPAATAWFESQLFGALDELVPFLVGDGEHFHVVIDFNAFPGLATALAPALGATPEQLLLDGFVLDDRELEAELGGSAHDALNDPNNALAIFRPAGYSITQVKLLNSSAATQDADGDGLDVATLRTVGSGVRTAHWLLPLVAALLAASIGGLSANGWGGRVACAAAALFVASTIAFAVAGPVYSATLGPRIERSLAEARAADAGSLTLLRDRALSRAESVADGAAWRMAATARNWALLSLVALAGSLVWSSTERRARARARDGLATADGAPTFRSP